MPSGNLRVLLLIPLFFSISGQTPSSSTCPSHAHSHAPKPVATTFVQRFLSQVQLSDAPVVEAGVSRAGPLVSAPEGLALEGSSEIFVPAVLSRVFQDVTRELDYFHEGVQMQQAVHYANIVLLIAMCVISLPFIGLVGADDYGGGFLGRTIRAGIHNFDRRVLGVGIDIRSLTVHPIDGFVDVEGLVIKNPSGYDSPYLLKAKKVMVDLDMMMLVRSRMKVISIQKLVFQDVHAILEQRLDTSNLDDVLNHLNKTMPPIEDDDIVYAIHKVAMENVSVTIRPSGMMGEYLHADVAAGDIHYRDFSTEVSSQNQISEIVRELLKTLLKTVTTAASKGAGRFHL